MSDISRQRLKRTIASALLNIDEMQYELAVVRAQCQLLQEEMRAIRVRSKRARIHSVPRPISHTAPQEEHKNSA
ncbi:hypothetical protein A9R00_07765 [Oleispira antarctica]|uniref:Uncharacterized protein n=1 Tax=Oleispira antarctica TaxID=188908 RepID=A0A1Y5HYD5_OLEAN|nr:hypothetical protein A9R00_07765 [Oleispira antarctica]